MKSLIEQGIEKKLIRFEDDNKYIVYIHQNKRRNYTNTEEHVQAETFLKLVLDYGYSAARIQQFVTVKMGISSKEADMIVHKDDACAAVLTHQIRLSISSRSIVKILEIS